MARDRQQTAEEPPAPEPAVAVGALADPFLESAAARVLVVDDHVQLAALTQMALEWAGYTVDVVHHGWLALARADRFRPHIVLCDLNLPDIDGTEVAARLRSTALGRSMIILACSGAEPDGPVEALLAAGFDAFLAKPVDMGQLLAAIKRAGGARPAPGA
jgi:CheY-like chemotaxis protein